MNDNRYEVIVKEIAQELMRVFEQKKEIYAHEFSADKASMNYFLNLRVNVLTILIVSILQTASVLSTDTPEHIITIFTEVARKAFFAGLEKENKS